MSRNKNNKTQSLVGLIIVLACLVPALWMLYERIDLMQHAEWENATIIKCDYRWNTGGGGPKGSRKSRTSYTPIAISEQGRKVGGSLWWPSRKFCERSLNKPVSVLIYKTAPDKSRINSFFQLWMLPSLLMYVGLIFAISLYLPGRGFAQILTVLLLVIMAVSYFRELHPTEGDLEGLDQENRSKVVLDRCVIDRMRKKDLTKRTQLKYLLCQKSGISDLSSISDLINLEELYLQGNQLSSLESLSNLPKLRIISVGNNGMTSLKGVERAPNLEELQANLNKISDLSGVQHLSKLKVVGLMRNQIKSIAEFRHLSELEDLVFNSNQIADIQPLFNKPALKELQVYSNDIRDITPLYGNINMRIVGIRGRGNVSCKQIQLMRSKLAPDAKVWGQKGC